MRIGLIIAGVVIAILGIAGLMGKLNFQKEDEVAKVGPISITDKKTEGIPQWAGIAAIIVGGVLVVGGAMKKS